MKKAQLLLKSLMLIVPFLFLGCSGSPEKVTKESVRNIPTEDLIDGVKYYKEEGKAEFEKARQQKDVSRIKEVLKQASLYNRELNRRADELVMKAIKSSYIQENECQYDRFFCGRMTFNISKPGHEESSSIGRPRMPQVGRAILTRRSEYWEELQSDMDGDEMKNLANEVLAEVRKEPG